MYTVYKAAWLGEKTSVHLLCFQIVIMAGFRAQFEITELMELFNIYSLIQDKLPAHRSPGMSYWAECLSLGLFTRHTACALYFKYRAMMPTFSRLER